MKNQFLIFLIIVAINSGLSAEAIQIVYPKSDEVQIQAATTFFIGNNSPESKLKINEKEVKIHSSGGFKHPVNLKPGLNIFKIEDENETYIYKITSVIPQKAKEPNYVSFDAPKTIEIIADVTPLRSTPINFGVNRLAHYNNGMKLSAVGLYGDFYKIQLTRDEYAWIDKNCVKIIDENIELAKILSYEYEELKNERIFKIKLSDKVPYTVFENNGYDVVLYNIAGFNFNKYEFHINPQQKSSGYEIHYTSDNELVIKIKNMPSLSSSNPLKGVTIAIDPGHGGNEYGAVGCLGDKEKDINLDISKKLAKLLSSKGAKVLLTREDDRDVTLQDRVAYANKNNSNLFISIHANALPDSLAKKQIAGTEVYFFYPQGKAFGKYVLDSLTHATGLKNSGLKAESFAVIRNTNCPSILVEVGYIIDPEDNSKLIIPEFQDKIAIGIAEGTINYLK